MTMKVWTHKIGMRTSNNELQDSMFNVIFPTLDIGKNEKMGIHSF